MKTIRTTVLVLIISTVFFTCKKKDKDECPVCPSVESISPTNARCFEKLTIFGKNFSATPAANIVKINGMQVNADSILSGSTDKLVVKVPKGCGTGPVTVDIDNELTNEGTPPVFTYLSTVFVTDIGTNLLNPLPCISNTSTGSYSNYVNPVGIILDANDNLYVADQAANCILKFSPSDNYQTPCLFAGMPWATGHDNQLGTSASFTAPMFMAIDQNNTIFVAEDGDTIRIISPNGKVENLKMSGADLGASSCIAFQPGMFSLAYVSLGQYQGQGKVHTINKLVKQGNTFKSTVFAGTKGTAGHLDGTGTMALFNNPQAVIVDNVGNIFVSEDLNHDIRKITPNGIVTTFAGSGAPQFADGQGTQASFNTPIGMCIDASNNIYVADNKNSCIRKITPSGLVSTIFTFTGTMNAPTPYGIVLSKNGDMFVTYKSFGGNGIKRISIQ
ncbi:MAG TPA: IPT/TIG domain-containing protein [Bacteroidia bacterium]|nr:IPT/TIG domain-containing protein [Bacteroidia bacterium]